LETGAEREKLVLRRCRPQICLRAFYLIRNGLGVIRPNPLMSKVMSISEARRREPTDGLVRLRLLPGSPAQAKICNASSRSFGHDDLCTG
jgi:hypothetical protein